MHATVFARPWRVQRRWSCLVILCLALLMLAACDEETPPVEVSTAPTATMIPLPTATATATATPVPTETATPLPSPTPTPVVFPEGVISATVTSVIDGITIAVEIHGEAAEVRYLLLAQPEERPAYAAEAMAQNEALVAGQTVYLEQDGRDRDSNGRLLRYVYLADGRMVNEMLVSEGHAQVANGMAATRYEETLRMRQADAMLAGSGMWGVPQGTVNRSATLRTGPGTEYESVGNLSAGETVEVVGRSENGAWYQLADGNWIARFQVDQAPLTLPIVQVTPTPAP